jgi:DNA-binding LacI/PurR family transcriptional regulator
MDVTGHTRELKPEAAPSIRDVAAAAGVSYQTVSRVINGHPSVRDSTREHVRTVIAQLGFRPNRAARALAGGPVQSVTVLTQETTLYGQAAALRGIEEAARAAGLAVGVQVVESTDRAQVGDAVTRAVQPGGALIVIAYDVAGTMALAAVPSWVPMAALVETPAQGEGDGQPWVWVDDRQAAMEATRYLLSLGHHTVHYLGIPSSTHTSQRKAGWLAALAEAGTRVPEPVQCGWTPRSGYQAGQLLAADAGVTALLCGNDDLAMGAMRALHEAGRDVPGQVSVVGFDDVPTAEFLTPALTTVRLDYAEAGRACVALLQALITGETTGTPVSSTPRPEPELIIRESAAPPPGVARAAARPARQPLDARQQTRESIS